MKELLNNRIVQIFVLIVAAIAAYFLFMPKTKAPNTDTQARPQILPANISAAVLEPADGSQFDDHAPISVHARGYSPDNIVSLELWVDGELANVLAAPQGGLALFTSEYLWQPPSPGDHTLVIRALDASGHSIYSKATHVKISAYDYEGAFSEDNQEGGPAVVALGSGLAAPGGGGGYPPSSIIPGPADSVGVGEPWSGSPEENSGDSSDDTLPVAPVLTLSVADCVVTVSIQDNSDNEEGFGVFRQMPNSAGWTQIGALSPQSEFEWISYEDAGAPGTPVYYVTAFNSYGESQSNLAPAAVDPSACPKNETELSVISIEIISLQFDMAAEKTYCYLSIAEQIWTRSPDTGFYNIGVAGDLDGNAPTQIIMSSNGSPDSAELPIALDCWGWVAGELYNLGQIFSAAVDLDDPGELMLSGEGMSAVLLVDLHNLFDISEVVTYDLTETYDYNMLQLSVSITDDINVCFDHLPPDFKNMVYCEPLPAPGTPGVFKFVTPLPQSYVVWDIIGAICLPGTPANNPCKPYSQWQNLFKQFDVGQIGFEVYEFNDQGSQLLSTYVYPFMQRDLIPRISDCNSGRLFAVRMWFEFNGTTVYSWPKDSHLGLAPSSIPCKPPPNQALLDLLKLMAQQQAEAEAEAQAAAIAAEVEAAKALDFVIMQVTFNTLTLANSDDDDFFDSQETLEIYRYFRVSVPNYPIDNHVPWEVRVGLINILGPAMYRNSVQIFVASDSQHKSCPDDTNASGDPGQESYFCPKRVTDGSYNLAGWTLCLGNGATCVETRPGGMSTVVNPQLTNNNVVHVLVFDGQRLWIESLLNDYDDGSYNDNACHGYVEFVPRSLADWAAIQNAPFTILGTGIDGGTCTVSGFISAVGP